VQANSPLVVETQSRGNINGEIMIYKCQNKLHKIEGKEHKYEERNNGRNK
jgi:hypothetical protein